MNKPDTLHIRGGEIPAEFALSDSVVPPASTTPGFVHSEILIDEGHIEAVAPALEVDTERTLDASECLVLPGFIDVHVHGAVGYDTMDADPAGLRAMATFYAQHGVTGFLATTMTARHDETIDAVRAVSACEVLPENGARIHGVHLEGSFISPVYPGAQKAENIREPNLS